MQTPNPHGIVTRKEVMIIPTKEIQQLYRMWKQLFLETTEKEETSFDSFMAGYFIGHNVMLKEKYINKIKENKQLGIDI